MMSNYSDAKYHSGSFRNINNKSAFSTDCVYECMHLQKVAAKTEVKENRHVRVPQVTTSLRWVIMGRMKINVALIREAFMCGGL